MDLAAKSEHRKEVDMPSIQKADGKLDTLKICWAALVLFFCSVSPAFAQTATPPTTLMLRHEYFYTFQETEIKVWRDSPDTSKTPLTIIVPNVGQTIWTFRIQADSGNIYWVEGPKQNLTPTPRTSTYLMRRANGNTTRLAEVSNIRRIEISPDEQFVAVSYEENGYNSPVFICIIAVNKSPCNAFGRQVDNRLKGRWASSTIFVDFDNGTLIGFDATNMSVITFPNLVDWFVYRFVRQPSTQALIIAASNRQKPDLRSHDFLMYNLVTGSLSLLPFKPKEDEYLELDDLGFSPDGQYFTYSNFENLSIVEYSTSKDIIELAGVASVAWATDSKTFTVYLSTGTETTSISTFEASTGIVISVLQTQSKATRAVEP